MDDQMEDTDHLDARRIVGPEACGRILLVGEDNPLSMDPRYALYHEPANCAGHRLQSRILGVFPRRTYLPMWRTNLCVGGWDRDAAEDRAETISRPGAPWRTIVMLGVKVARAFCSVTRIETRPLGEPTRFGEIAIVSLPHPSGRNLIWNDPSAVRAAREILRGLSPAIRWGEIDELGTER